MNDSEQECERRSPREAKATCARVGGRLEPVNDLKSAGVGVRAILARFVVASTLLRE